MRYVVKYKDKLFYNDELPKYLEELKIYRNKSLRKKTVIDNITKKSLTLL